MIASDAFFPFPDGPMIALEAGVRGIIQPGGSKRDSDVVAAVERRRRDDGLYGPAPLPALTTGAAAPTLRARTRPRKSPVRPETRR